MNRQENEDDEQYLERLANLPDFNQTVFKRYLLKDCLHSLNSIKHLDNEHINKVIDLIEKWLSDPSSVTEEQFRSAATAALAVAYVIVSAAGTTYAYWAARAAAYAAKAANAAKASWVSTYAAWAARTVSYSTNAAWEETKANKIKQYLRFAKKLVYKPNFPQNFVSYILNSQTEEELNVWLIDYAQEHDLPDVRKYISFLYEKEYSSDMIIGNKELEHLLN